MRVLVVGGSGFLGRELVRRCLAAGHEVAATYLSRPVDDGDDDAREAVAWLRLDVRSRADAHALVARVRPDVLVNAAYLQTDWSATADGPAHLALAAAAHGSRLVHVSSDVVFSGARTRYPETCVPDPISPYGAAKAAAETAVRAILPGAAIVRTSLIIGGGSARPPGEERPARPSPGESAAPGSPSEVLVHALATGRARGVLFADEVRCPVHVGDLASALLELAAPDRGGTYHAAGADALSRHRLGLLIARRDGLDPALLTPGERAASGVPGPLAVRLDCTATQRLLGTRLRGAEEFLAAAAP
ncbi:sugar nucleotide-binding protein [Nonomuraea sp. NN258]|uniref:SDR family oxidoreductase n=1 Tax=Nonomuraea antri TaxID=2730852 RepID=UPI00156818FD|nr:sugar nucleotide-binding protein [Nonomuraea antri]NRQ35207.1 sugar nucleotide-binding protein [Nonomuraea antri]